jgi:Ca-activated chloride channel family protein
MRRNADRVQGNREPTGDVDRERDWRLLVGGVLVFAFLIVVASAARAGGAGGTGALVLQTSSGEVMAPWLDTEMDVHVSGLIARVTVRQRFINDRPEWVEGIYAFPLPDCSAVHALRMRVGERVIVGEVHEHEQARTAYNEARESGQRASLVEQARPNLFRTSIANLAPYDVVEVELEYLQIVSYDGLYSLRLPMTITPRYDPPALLARDGAMAAAPALTGDLGELAPPVLRHEEDLRSLGSVHIELDAGFALAGLTSAYHAIHVVRDGLRYTVDLAAGKVPLDRDFELVWRPISARGPAPRCSPRRSTARPTRS